MDEKKTPVNPKLTPKHSIDRDRHYLPSRFQVEKYQPKSVKTFFQELEELGKSSLVRSRVLQPLSKEEIRNRPLKRYLVVDSGRREITKSLSRSSCSLNRIF